MKSARVVAWLALAALSFVVATAQGGETALGRVWIADAGVTNNLYPSDGGFFAIRTPAKVSVQCTQDVYLCTDATTCSSITGVKVLAGTLFPTSVDTNSVVTSEPTWQSDGGTKLDGGLVLGTLRNGGVISVVPVTSVSNQCTYFIRKGSE